MARINRNRLKDAASALLIRGFFAALRLVPFDARRRLAGALFALAVPLVPALRRRVTGNLALGLPGLAPDLAGEIRAEVGRSVGMSMAEIFSPSDMDRESGGFTLVGAGFDALMAARAGGRGAILVSGHFGQWEAARLALRARGIEVAGVYRPSNNPAYDRDFHRALEAFGRPVFANTPSGIRGLLRHVSAGGVAMMLIDQHIRAMPVLRFMGLPARTPTIAADIALKYDVPLIAAYGIRRKGGWPIDVVLEAPVPRADALIMTQALNDSLEARVRDHPGQWYWLHHRWRKKELSGLSSPRGSGPGPLPGPG
jgi:KDO2-lipid IV(A) lauroyltransferase